MHSQQMTFDNEKAQMQQQILFCNETIKDLKQRHAEAKIMYQNTLENLESAKGQANEELENQRLIDLKNCHAQEIDNLESEHENVKRKLEMDIENLTKKRDELDLALKLEQTTRQSEKQSSEDEINTLKHNVERLTEKAKILERQMTTKIMEKDAESERKIRALEDEMENLKERQSMELNERQR